MTTTTELIMDKKLFNLFYENFIHKCNRINTTQWWDSDQKYFMNWNSDRSKDFKDFFHSIQPFIDKSDIEIEYIKNFYKSHKSQHVATIIYFKKRFD
jgi:hypothetical protein